jgi:TetR/AcrR family transcriptional regulator, transcriptional repressor for nem operon
MQARQKRLAKEKLLDAAVSVIRMKGYAASTVDDLCAAAGVTKGAFFHHFKSKEELAVAAADYWSESADDLFANAPYHRHADPLDRVLGYVDFRKTLLAGALFQYTCLVGTMVQETYDSNPAIRDACARSIMSHAAKVEADIREAIEKHRLKPPWTAASLALYMQAVLQGAFIIAKTKGNARDAAACVDHLRRYVELLFDRAQKKEKAR